MLSVEGSAITAFLAGSSANSSSPDRIGVTPTLGPLGQLPGPLGADQPDRRGGQDKARI
ncbi:MAG: hypothetical protein WAL12_13130 [Trebonia sp.]